MSYDLEELESVDESEEGDDGPGSNGGQFPSSTMPTNMIDFSWDFINKKGFKEAIKMYVVHSRRNLKIIKNDNMKVRVKCTRAQRKVRVVCILWVLIINQLLAIMEINDIHSVKTLDY